MAALPQEITQLLLSWSKGDQAALEQLIPLVYPELKRLARRYMLRENPALDPERRRQPPRPPVALEK